MVRGQDRQGWTMFLRRCIRKKNGKPHSYWALVESYRTARGSRQRLVAYVGELKPSERSGWAQLGRRLEKKARPQPSLFDPPPPANPTDEEFVEVHLQDVRFERLRDFGDVWLALGLWRLLGLDTLLAEQMPDGRAEVPWAAVAAILTMARFCAPSSELHIEDHWYARTALEDLLGVPVPKVHADRLYAGLDRLLEHKESLEKHLQKRLGDLFDLKYELLLYDVTSTYFEGLCEANPMAQRGYSRDSRPDCLQVCIGLVVTEDGMPLGHEVFDGNTHDSKTLETIVKAMEAKYGRAHRIWVVDRGMVSEANLKFLRGQGASYIVGTPKALLRQFEQHLTDQDWQQVQEGVEVKLVHGPDGQEVFVLARSRDRRQKEQAMHQRFVGRMEAALQKMQQSAATGRLKDLALAQRRWGRLQQRYWRAAKAFDVKMTPIDPPVGKAKITITYSRNTPWSDWTALSEGCYLLRTNLTDVDAQTLWKRYIQLTEAEWAFRITKDELVIRPIWHQKPERVKAHILVCFLAYVLWKTLGQWMHRAGLGDAPRTLLLELAKIKSGDVVLPVRRSLDKPSSDQADSPDRVVRLRCVTAPDEAQKVLLHRLGLTLPQRLRRIDKFVQM
jgi:Transposase DDE domain